MIKVNHPLNRYCLVGCKYFIVSFKVFLDFFIVLINFNEHFQEFINTNRTKQTINCLKYLYLTYLS